MTVHVIQVIKGSSWHSHKLEQSLPTVKRLSENLK